MDGRGGPFAPTRGGGIVNCQGFVGVLELFRISMFAILLGLGGSWVGWSVGVGWAAS
jgi:hypothetical protein